MIIAVMRMTAPAGTAATAGATGVATLKMRAAPPMAARDPSHDRWIGRCDIVAGEPGRLRLPAVVAVVGGRGEAGCVGRM
jgi:hypothetical protein